MRSEGLMVEKVVGLICKHVMVVVGAVLHCTVQTHYGVGQIFFLLILLVGSGCSG